MRRRKYYHLLFHGSASVCSTGIFFSEGNIKNRSVHLPLIYVESELREKFSEKTELVFQSITNPSHF